MKQILYRYPELFGVLLGLLDAIPRVAAATFYAPGKATVHGWLLVGNVHHVNGTMAFGLNTMHWLGIGACLLLVFYTTTRALEILLDVRDPWSTLARGALGVVAGVLLLNVGESFLTGKVTNYFGFVSGTRFTALNLGDVLVWWALPLFAFVLAIGITLRLCGTTARA